MSKTTDLNLYKFMKLFEMKFQLISENLQMSFLEIQSFQFSSSRKCLQVATSLLLLIVTNNRKDSLVLLKSFKEPSGTTPISTCFSLKLDLY